MWSLGGEKKGFSVYEGEDVPKGVPNRRALAWLYNKSTKSLLKTYLFLLQKSKARDLQTLITESMQELGIESLEQDALNKHLYESYKVHITFSDEEVAHFLLP